MCHSFQRPHTVEKGGKRRARPSGLARLRITSGKGYFGACSYGQCYATPKESRGVWRVAELWTFVGINSQKDGVLVDGVSAALASRRIARAHAPDRSYVSRLGTGRRYPRERNVLKPNPESMLDEEARRFAKGEIESGLGMPAGGLSAQDVRVMFLAPKSDTSPAGAFDCAVYWSAHDKVPNQKIPRFPSLRFWRSWARELRDVGGSANVYPVKATHGVKSVLGTGRRAIAKRERKGGAGGKGSSTGTYQWVSTRVFAPDPIETVHNWLDTPDSDIVVVAHSQGANVALAVLNRGLRA